MLKNEADKTENMASNSENISTESTQEISIENIFEDFQDNSDLWDEIEQVEKQIQKDFLYYLNLTWTIFKYLNIVLFILIIIWFSYIYIQKDNSWVFNDSPFLQIVCPVLIWWGISLEDSTCSPLTSSINNYQSKLKQRKDDTLSKTLDTIKDAYVIEDLISSDKVGFALDKTQNKQNPLFILTKFDNLKKSFTWLDKSQIQCSNIVIKDNSFSAHCSSYSSSWNSWITWFNWSKWSSDTVAWTSISIASSFLNYLELDPNIILENKQKTFSQENVIDWAYINKTNFDVKFNYKTDILPF